jgi:hypothetical protein
MHMMVSRLQDIDSMVLTPIRALQVLDAVHQLADHPSSTRGTSDP